jgi:hypothetical protein
MRRARGGGGVTEKEDIGGTPFDSFTLLSF